MAKVNEGAARVVEGVVPAVGVFVLVRLLYPLEDLEEGAKLDLTIRQTEFLESFFVAFASTFLLAAVNTTEIMVRSKEDDNALSNS